MKRSLFGLLFLFLFFNFCSSPNKMETPDRSFLTNTYVTFRLTADLSHLTENEREIIRRLIEAAKIMNELFWFEAYGDPSHALELAKTPEEAAYIRINYGPWDRLNGNEPFITGIGAKPLGANFYPADMTKKEFDAADLPDKASLYTFLRRDADGDLFTVPYYEMFSEEIERVAQILESCAKLTNDDRFRDYLLTRAEGLRTDNYQPSDFAWMDMKTNRLDVVIGPIENYEDALFNYKAAHEAYVLVKDMQWSEKLAKYAAFLPDLQRNLPVSDAYKKESPGADADLNAYDVVYYAGDCNAGSKTIAINLPNDEDVQLKKGSRRLQLKNAMKAKYDMIMQPITSVLIADDQVKYVTFDAFFANTMFHEIAHGLGIKNTINGKGTVRNALKEHFSALEEGKADVLGLYMVTQLHEQGELEGDLKEYYTTFLAGIFRSVRFGASSAHGKANMIRFNYFAEAGAFSRDATTGKYRVDFDKMKTAMNDLSSLILMLQGNGDYDEVDRLVREKGLILPELQNDLDRLKAANIPVDIVFEQGVEVLGL